MLLFPTKDKFLKDYKYAKNKGEFKRDFYDMFANQRQRDDITSDYAWEEIISDENNYLDSCDEEVESLWTDMFYCEIENIKNRILDEIPEEDLEKYMDKQTLKRWKHLKMLKTMEEI